MAQKVQPASYQGDQQQEQQNLTEQQQVPPQLRRLTAEEMKVFRECNRESFWYRSMPLAGMNIVAVRMMARYGYLKPSPFYGMYLKYAGAIVLGYFVGKFSYLSKCREKLMRLPNSELAEALRKSYGGKRQLEVLQEMVTLPEINTGGGGDQGYAPLREGSDMYTSPDFRSGGGQDTQQGGSDDHSSQKPSTTYDDLRRRNREDYLKQQFRVGGPSSSTGQQQQQSQQSSQQQQQPPSQETPQSKSKFTYGDSQQAKSTTKYGDQDFK